MQMNDIYAFREGVQNVAFVHNEQYLPCSTRGRILCMYECMYARHCLPKADLVEFVPLARRDLSKYQTILSFALPVMGPL